MSVRFDVVIVGAGMVGATLACALGDSRLKVAVLDSRAPAVPPQQDYDLRVSALTLASRAIFENLGAWEAMRRRRVAPVEAMRIWESAQETDGNFRGEIRFDAADIGEPCLAYIVENSVIQQALVERMQGFTNVHALWPVEIEGMVLAEGNAELALKDGRRIETRVLIGADGADSAVRRAAGIESRRLDLDQQAIVATVRMQTPHARTAYQRFLPTGPIAFLPLAEADLCSIVWSADGARAKVLIALDDAAFADELQTAIGHGSGAGFGGVRSVSPRQTFDLALAHAQSYVAPRAALIGDAAHTVHPLAGQGVNLGLLDAAVLAGELLDAAARGRDIGGQAPLRRYQRARRGDNLGMLAVTGGFKYLFGSSRAPLRGLRSVGLSVTDRATPLKRWIMRRASGLDGDVPALARRRVK